MSKTKDTRKRWSRKGRCPHCNAQTGSRHQYSCTFAYILPPKAKAIAENKTFKRKIQNILHSFIENI